MPGSRFVFDDYSLDCAAGELRRGTTSVELRPKVYELLLFLVENRGRLVPKEELFEAIWGEVHVTDGSLNRTITDLRHALNDDPRRPRLIETVARRGYRFIGSVTEVAASIPSALSEFALVTDSRVYTLRFGENIIGRTPECHVQIIGPSVSRRHARIVVAGQSATLEDLGSLNGTFISDVRVTASASLSDGDEVRIGKERLRLIADRTVRARTEPAI